MWYAIHTKTGYEQDLINILKARVDTKAYNRFIIPTYENVDRARGENRITYRKILPGYVLIDTERPEDVAMALKRVKEFAKILSTEEADGKKKFAKIDRKDMDFFESIFGSGIMAISYLEFDKNRRLKKVYGPLAKYANYITKLDYRNRRAIVETDVLGKRRRIKFSIWTDEDPSMPFVEEQIAGGGTTEYMVKGADIGIHPRDRVRSTTDLFKDRIFIVKTVNTKKRTFTTEAGLLGGGDIELSADDVERI